MGEFAACQILNAPLWTITQQRWQTVPQTL